MARQPIALLRPRQNVIGAPLVAARNAQCHAAGATLDYIRGLISDDGKPFAIEFEAQNGPETAKIRAPLLSMVPVPHLRIDPLTTHFTFEISQTESESKEQKMEGSLNVGAGPFISKFVTAELKGSMSSKWSKESTTNRSGQLEVTVQASESPIPEGLARIFSMLAKSIEADGG